MRLLFWNTHNAKINNIIACAVRSMHIDFIILAEYKGDVIELCNLTGMRKYASIGCEEIFMFGFQDNVDIGEQDSQFSFQIIGGQYILGGIHLPSRMYDGHQTRRNIVIQKIIDAVRRHETDLGTKKTIIVGDFNEDPYEDGCLSAMNFFGLPYVSLKDTRIIERTEFEKFYNPMWNLFGDFSNPPGTYFYNESNPNGSYWHIFDQVMIRPCLRKSFKEESLKIITVIGATNLLADNGKPDTQISDHLPIVFEIKED